MMLVNESVSCSSGVILIKRIHPNSLFPSKHYQTNWKKRNTFGRSMQNGVNEINRS